MTRKHYELIAKALAEARTTCESDEELSGVNRAVAALVIALRDTNPRFDSGRFIVACK